MGYRENARADDSQPMTVGDLWVSLAVLYPLVMAVGIGVAALLGSEGFFAYWVGAQTLAVGVAYLTFRHGPSVRAALQRVWGARRQIGATVRQGRDERSRWERKLAKAEEEAAMYRRLYAGRPDTDRIHREAARKLAAVEIELAEVRDENTKLREQIRELRTPTERSI